MTKDDLINMGCDPQEVEDWLAVRKLKKKPLTQTAVKRMKTEAEKAGMTLPEAVGECAANGWLGFKAEYVSNQQQAQRRVQKATVAESLRDINNTDW